jgi:hypothetical protein
MRRRLIAALTLLVPAVTLLPATGHAQSVDHINRCTALLDRINRLEMDESKADEMIDYKKGILKIEPGDLKNFFLPRWEVLERQRSSQDPEAAHNSLTSRCSPEAKNRKFPSAFESISGRTIIPCKRNSFHSLLRPHSLSSGKMLYLQRTS